MFKSVTHHTAAPSQVACISDRMAQPSTQLSTDDIQRVRGLDCAAGKRAPCSSLTSQLSLWLQMLEENYVYIKTIVDQQNLGRLPQMQE